MNWKRLFICTTLGAVLVAVFGAGAANRYFALYRDSVNVASEVKYLIETGGTIGETPADTALSSSYLEIVFGDDPELLDELKAAVDKGMQEMPEVLDGEVAAIVVTYNRGDNDEVENVVAHIMGGFPLGKRDISMHRDGFFSSQIGANLWQTGDSAIRFLGRDMVMWAGEDASLEKQQELINAIFSGEIVPLADNIAQKPLHFTAVFPSPDKLVPSRMRQHVRAILIGGSLAPDAGSFEITILAAGEKSTALVGAMAEDIKKSMEIALRTRFAGAVRETAWGPHIPVWWSYEMANTVQLMEITRKNLTVTLKSNFERRMVNATLKSIERFGRDFSQIEGVMDQKLDPRQVDARMKSGKPVHYWSDSHRWGPDWPFGSGTNIMVRRPEQGPEAENEAPPVTEPL